MQKYVSFRLWHSPEESPHLFHSGDRVLLNTWKKQGSERQLVEKWMGPYNVLLTTHSALKVAVVMPWVNHIQLKQALTEETHKSRGPK